MVRIVMFLVVLLIGAWLVLQPETGEDGATVVKKMDMAKVAKARAEVERVVMAYVQYCNTRGRAPKTLQDVTVYLNPPSLNDPWFHSYQLETKGKEVVVLSPGPDGEAGTEDDIRSRSQEVPL